MKVITDLGGIAVSNDRSFGEVNRGGWKRFVKARHVGRQGLRQRPNGCQERATLGKRPPIDINQGFRL